MKKIMRGIGLGMSGVLAFSLAACTVVTSETSEGGESTATTAEEPSTEGEATAESSSEPALSGELEVQIFTNESEAANAGWNEVLDLFEEATGVTVVRNMGSQVNEQMQTRWMQGDPPDIFLMDGAGISDEMYVDGGLLMDISEIIDDGTIYGTDQKIADSIDANLMPRMEDGTIYKAAFLRTTHGVWYDAKYLQDNGFEVPTHYSEFVEVSQKAVESGIAPLTYAGQHPSYPLAGLFFPAFGAYGQEYFDAVTSADPEAFASDNMKDILTRWRDYCAQDGFILPGTTTMDHTSSQIAWLGHESLFIPVGMWLPDEVRASTPEDFEMTYTLSPMIADDQPTTAVYSAKYIGVAAEAKNAENAKAFIRFLFTEEAQTILMKNLSAISVLKDLDYEKATSGVDPAIASIMTMASSAENQIYNRATWGAVQDAFNNVIVDLTLGNIDVEEAQQQLVAACEEEKGNT